MSLDKNLFTLIFTPHKDNPNVIDLVDPSGTVHYRKQRVPGTAEYKVEVYDPTSESLLATATAPSASSKVKTIELCNPTCTVELLRHTGTLSSKWSFKWEDHEFEWKKEECFIVRKPDPPVIISVTKELTGRLKSTTVQMLDYNLNRFDIDDRKGLEIVILTALLTFSDVNDSPDGNTANPLSRATSVGPSVARDAPPPPPPKPAPKTGVERVAELQAVRGEYNEIIISDEGTVADYAVYCNRLLQDDAMLFVSVKSAEAIQVPKVLQVVEETKRIRYKAGLDQEEGLHQYVLYDQKEERKGPRIINLDDERKNKYAPPKNLTVHLSKIAMPELQPKSTGNEKITKSSRKEDKKAAPPQNPRPQPITPQTANMPSLPLPSSSKPPTKLHRPPNKQAPPQRQPQQADQIRVTAPQFNNPGSYAAPRPAKGSRPPRPSDPLHPPYHNPDPRRISQPNLHPHPPYQNPQYLRAPSPNIPGAWQPSPPSTPPPPQYFSGPPPEEKGNAAAIAQGASTMVQGLRGLISTGKLK